MMQVYFTMYYNLMYIYLWPSFLSCAGEKVSLYFRLLVEYCLSS